MQIRKNILVKSTKHKKPILTDVFYNSNKKKKPLVIFCHGYKGYKDWGAWNLAAEEFANNDIFFLKFNFSHNGGTVDEPIDFPDLEAFGQNNFIIELDDLEDVIHWIISSDFANEIDVKNITLIGHSRGGGIVTLKASENASINKIISWAGVSDYGKRFPKGDALKMWEDAGVSFIQNARTKQQMPHYFQFYSNFKKNEERLTIKRAVSVLKIPHLIIQGEKDEVVKKEEAEKIHSWNSDSTFLLINDMNHPLGCTQPWNKNEMPMHLSVVVKESINFIKK